MSFVLDQPASMGYEDDTQNVRDDESDLSYVKTSLSDVVDLHLSSPLGLGKRVLDSATRVATEVTGPALKTLALASAVTGVDAKATITLTATADIPQCAWNRLALGSVAFVLLITLVWYD